MKIRTSQLKALIIESITKALAKEGFGDQPLTMKPIASSASLAGRRVEVKPVARNIPAVRGKVEPSPDKGKSILKGILSGEIDVLELDPAAKASVQMIVKQLGITINEARLKELLKEKHLQELKRDLFGENVLGDQKPEDLTGSPQPFGAKKHDTNAHIGKLFALQIARTPVLRKQVESIPNFSFENFVNWYSRAYSSDLYTTDHEKEMYSTVGDKSSNDMQIQDLSQGLKHYAELLSNYEKRQKAKQ